MCNQNVNLVFKSILQHSIKNATINSATSSNYTFSRKKCELSRFFCLKVDFTFIFQVILSALGRRTERRTSLTKTMKVPRLGTAFYRCLLYSYWLVSEKPIAIQLRPLPPDTIPLINQWIWHDSYHWTFFRLSFHVELYFKNDFQAENL